MALESDLDDIELLLAELKAIEVWDNAYWWNRSPNACENIALIGRKKAAKSSGRWLRFVGLESCPLRIRNKGSPLEFSPFPDVRLSCVFRFPHPKAVCLCILQREQCVPFARGRDTFWLKYTQAAIPFLPRYGRVRIVRCAKSLDGFLEARSRADQKSQTSSYRFSLDRSRGRCSAIAKGFAAFIATMARKETRFREGNQYG